MFTLLILALLLSATVQGQGQEFKIPEATLEFLSPKGLRISVPDWDEDVTLVAFHVNVNELFYGVEGGQYAADIHRKRDGRWSLTIPELRVQHGDTVYYWVYAIQHGRGYQNLHRSYQPRHESPHISQERSSMTTLLPGGYSTPAPYPESYSMNLATQGTTLGPSPEGDSMNLATRGTTPAPSPVGDVVDWRGHCVKSLSTVSLTEGSQFPCSGSLVYEAKFRSDTDLEGWVHQVFIGASDSEDAFTVFTSDKNVSSIVNNALLIKPGLLEHKYSADFVRRGSLTLNDCTATQRELCSAEGVLPPVLSARLTTRGRFSFRYGLIEVRAKLPRGDYIVPELWLEPKYPSVALSRVVLGRQRVRQGDVLLEAGLDSTVFNITQPSSWINHFHVFKLIWSPDKMEFYIDGDLLGNLNVTDRVTYAALDAQFYITLGVHVGGVKDFPDSADSEEETKPWRNSDPKAKLTFWRAQSRWHGSWSEDSALQVDYVKVTAL